MDPNDPKTVEKLTQFYQEELSPEALAERQAHPEQGKVSDDDVQRATDLADGKDDGIVNEPESDVQAAIHVYEDGMKDAAARFDLAVKAAKAIFTKGERHIDSEDWGALARILGPGLVTLIKAFVLLVK